MCFVQFVLAPDELVVPLPDGHRPEPPVGVQVQPPADQPWLLEERVDHPAHPPQPLLYRVFFISFRGKLEAQLAPPL